MTQGKLFIISAPSGTGKTSLIKETLKRLNNNKISKVITYTARPPRPNEINGEDYYFISASEFNDKQSKNFFLESTDYLEKQYASPASILDDLELGLSKILIVDRTGAKNISKVNCQKVLIWIEPPNMQSLKNRLAKRATESHKQIEKRLNVAQTEMDEEKEQRLFEYHIINDIFEDSVTTLMEIINNELAPNKLVANKLVT